MGPKYFSFRKREAVMSLMVYLRKNNISLITGVKDFALTCAIEISPSV
jgi:hypothetical protein